jgi:hypothetical protein
MHFQADIHIDALDQFELPGVDLRHLHQLTDDVGILQHAKYAIPDRNHGYCVDDNARALIVACRHHALFGASDSLRLAQRYLAFLGHAFNPGNGCFRNFMSYDRNWLEEQGSEDSHGRALWGLGVAAASLPVSGYRDTAVWLITQAAPAVQSFSSPRAWAFSILGLNEYLRTAPGNEECEYLYLSLALRLCEKFECNAAGDWEWCEDIITYSNAILPYALIIAGRTLDDQSMIDRGVGALRWLLQRQTSPDSHLSIIGNNGWHTRDGQRARFDQQPVDAKGLVLATLAAYTVTRDESWLRDARMCFEWFTGANDLGIALYDQSTGGCCDGLMSDGINLNQGAESTLAWLISLQAMYEAINVNRSAFSPVNEQTSVVRRTFSSAFVRTNGNGNGHSNGNSNGHVH